jgi:hypothetical protein
MVFVRQKMPVSEQRERFFGPERKLELGQGLSAPGV